MRSFLLAAVAMVCVLQAQDFRATLNGRVTDPHDAPVAGALVSLRDVDKNETLRQTADAEGNYVFPLISPGSYELTVTHPGFKGYKRAGLTLSVNQAATVDLKMELGSTSEQVTVTSDLPLLELSSGDRGGLVDGKTTSEMPLNPRNPSIMSHIT